MSWDRRRGPVPSLFLDMVCVFVSLCVCVCVVSVFTTPRLVLSWGGGRFWVSSPPPLDTRGAGGLLYQGPTNDGPPLGAHSTLGTTFL